MGANKSNLADATTGALAPAELQQYEAEQAEGGHRGFRDAEEPRLSNIEARYDVPCPRAIRAHVEALRKCVPMKKLLAGIRQAAQDIEEDVVTGAVDRELITEKIE